MAYNSELWRTEQYHTFKSVGDLGDFGQVVIGTAAQASKQNPIDRKSTRLNSSH